MTEYEKSLFRVYERCVHGLGQGTTSPGQRVCLGARHLCFGLAALSSFLLLLLHFCYVDTGGCLVAQLELQLPPLPNATANSTNSTNSSGGWAGGVTGSTPLGGRLPDDVLLYVHVERTTRGDPLFGAWVSIEEERRRLHAFDTRRASATAPGNTTALAAADADYVFAVLPSVLARRADAPFRAAHRFEERHVTLPASACFGGGLPRALLEHVAGFDTAVLNMLMWGLRSDGTALNVKTGEMWNWYATQLDAAAGAGAARGVLKALLTKLVSLGAICFAYWVASSVTALVVHVLVASGVAMMWPTFRLLARCGVHLNLAALAASYPWVGRALEALELRGQTGHRLISAHLAHTLVFYLLYQGCHMAWRVWFYYKSLPSGVLVWLWSLVMLSEYFSMLFVRCEKSVAYFPELAFALFFAWHAYFYGFVYGYAYGALGIVWLLALGGMCVVVQSFEVAALGAGHISEARPRCVSTTLGWPSWQAELPQLFSVFMVPVMTARPGAAVRAEAQVAAGGTVAGAVRNQAEEQEEDSERRTTAPSGAAAEGAVAVEGSAEQATERTPAPQLTPEARPGEHRPRGQALSELPSNEELQGSDEDDVELQLRSGGAQSARWRARLLQRQRNLEGGMQYRPMAGAEPSL